MGFFKIRNDCTKNVMKNKKRQYKGGKMTTRQTFTAFLINNNECNKVSDTAIFGYFWITNR